MQVCDKCLNIYKEAFNKIIFKPPVTYFANDQAINEMPLTLCDECYNELFNDIKHKIDEATIEQFS